MRDFKFSKLALKKTFAVATLATVLLSNCAVLATDEEKLEPLYTEDFIKWQSLSDDEKKDSVMPRVSTTLTTDDMMNQYSQNYVGYRQLFWDRNFSKSFSDETVRAANYTSPSYNLKSNVSVAVRHQGSTNECWAFSLVSSLETNLELTRKVIKSFSPRHMDYATARTFTNGKNPLGYGREVGDGGLAPMGLSYLTNGQGAVLEKDMPFKDDESKISLSEIDKPVDTIVTDYTALPAIYKQYARDNGEVVYTNGGSGDSLVIYKDNEVKELRNIIKDHIVKYGAVAAVTAGNQRQYYSNPNDPMKSKSYFCNDSSIVRDHAVTIVGWDDNYSRDNFTGSAKPSTNGAYITLNSYGTESFDQGYLYISYEDALIETLLYGINSTSDVDYDTLYQYNPFGDNSAVGIQNKSEGYIASVYTRNVSKNEELKYVGVSIPDDVSLEIYVNAKGNTTTLSNLTKIATTGVLKPGYHRIPVTATKLTGNTFAIVVKEISSNNRFYFSIETGLNNSIYENITGNPGKTLYSTDGYTWKSLSSQVIQGLDMTRSDTCIKAFTDFVEESKPNPVDPEPTDPDPDEPDNPDNPGDDTKITITSTTYSIKNKDIYKIPHNTTLKMLQKNLTTNSTTFEVYRADGSKLAEDDRVKNGMTLKLSDGQIYHLIVRGDVDSTGTISTLDFTKFLAHYTHDAGCELTGDALKAADLSCDGRISLLDLSQFVVLYTSVD